MSEIDPVILQLRADLNKYLSDLRSTTTKVDKMLGDQQRSAQRLEREMKRSSTAIAGHLRNIASTLAGYFTGRELVGLLDNFTRLQNSLRVAGLEGNELKSVQDQLLETASRYGVEINGLADLYGRASQAQKDLSASSGDMLSITTATAQALKITGTNSAQASGAILGLTQALSSGIVRAEEFNQINEGGLRPLLQVVAAGDRWGGSVAKLRQAVVDGKVSSQEFFRSILAGSAVLEGQAAKAALTLAGGFTALTNALTVYFGEADKANGVSAALGEALGAVADNLDTLIPAMAIVATAIGVRYVVGATAATAATIATSNAMFALQARALGAATSMEALTFAMNGMKGGLVTVAILALGGAFYYLATRENTAADAAARYQGAVSKANQTRDKAADLARKLAAATGEERRQTELAISAALKKARADQIAGAAALKRAAAELALAQAAQARVEKSESANTTGRGSAELGTVRSETNRNLRIKTGEVRALVETQRALNEAVKILKDPLSLPPLPSLGGVPAGEGAKKAGRTRAGPSAADIEQRFYSELAGLAQQALSAESSIVRSAEQKAELELRSVEIARIRTEAEIKANKDYTNVQKERLLTQLDVLAELEREAIDFNKRRQLEQEAQQLSDEEFRAKSDALRLEFDLADTQEDRKRLALQILDAEQEHLRSTLKAVAASQTATDAEKRRAQIALDALNAISSAERSRVARQNETASERYLRELNKSPQQINEAIDDIKIEGLDALNDGLVDAIMGVKSLGDVFRNVAKQIIADLLRIAIQKAIVGTLANVLFGGGVNVGAARAGAMSAVDAGISSFRLPGFADGTNSAPRGLAVVGERGPELVRFRGGEQVIPNHLIGSVGPLRSSRGGPTNINVTVNAKDAVLTHTVRQWVAEGVQQATLLGSQIGAGQAEGRIMSRNRRRIPS